MPIPCLWARKSLLAHECSGNAHAHVATANQQKHERSVENSHHLDGTAKREQGTLSMGAQHHTQHRLGDEHTSATTPFQGPPPENFSTAAAASMHGSSKGLATASEEDGGARCASAMHAIHVTGPECGAVEQSCEWLWAREPDVESVAMRLQRACQACPLSPLPPVLFLVASRVTHCITTQCLQRRHHHHIARTASTQTGISALRHLMI
jgi:hypothetical protein